MPDYNYTITVPKSTSKDNPIKVTAKLTKGVLAGGEIFFPSGCCGLCHITINDSSGQLYPANKDGSFHGDGIPTELVGRHVLDEAPYKLTIMAWNEDDTYQHEPQVTLHVLSEEELSPWIMLRDLLTVFKRMLGLR